MAEAQEQEQEQEQAQAQEQETLSFEQIMDYMDNHPKIYQYIINKKEEDSDVKFTFADVMTNSIVLFLAIRKKLGWEIWPEDIKDQMYSKSITILYDNKLLEEIQYFTINKLKQLLRMSNGFLGYVAYERLPHIFLEYENIPKDEAKKDMLCMLKSLFKYRYETNEDFDLVFGQKSNEENKTEFLKVPYVSMNILAGMTYEEIDAWANAK